MHFSRNSMWLALVFGNIATLSATPPVIGVARSRGAFMIDNDSVPGNATILDGTSVKTMEQPSNVRLNTGQNLTLGSVSIATIFKSRLVLESGVAEVDRLSAYRVEAGKLVIGASSPEAGIRVVLEGAHQIQIAAVAGTAEVRNMDGLLLARVLPGTALQLQTAGPGNAADLTGKITSDHGKFYLTDETTKVRWEVQGDNLSEFVGKRVHVTGTTNPPRKPGAPAVVAVTSTTALTGAAAAGVGGAAAGGAAAGAATAGGFSMAAIALIAVAATAGTLGGLAAAGTFSSSSASR